MSSIDVEGLTRQIVGISLRSSEEVFEIMCDRIRLAHQAHPVDPVKEKMAEALKPFAAFIDGTSDFWADDRRISTINFDFDKLKVGLFRAARAALATYEAEKASKEESK